MSGATLGRNCMSRSDLRSNTARRISPMAIRRPKVAAHRAYPLAAGNREATVTVVSLERCLTP